MDGDDTILRGRYRLLNKIGQGGFGAVWRAEDLESRDAVAVKILRATSAEARQRFAIEISVLERLVHPNCVPFLDAGETSDGTPFIVTQYAEGENLRAWIGRNPPLGAKMAVARQIADAIRCAHGLGIAHRDLKPPNILVQDRSGTPHVVVLDFGLAKVTGRIGPALTEVGAVLGTPGYMSPEQIGGANAGPASDIYSLGVILYELFEGRPPFVAESPFDLCVLHLQAAPPPPLLTPDHLREIIALMLAKAPATRPAIEVVARALAERSTREPGKPAQIGTRWGLVALAFIAVAGVVAFIATRPDESSTEPELPAKQRENPLALAPVAVPQNTQRSDDMGSADADSPILRPDECDLPLGKIEVIEDKPGAVTGMTMYLPTTLAKGAAAVLLARDAFQISAQLANSHKFQCLAEHYGFAILAPHDDATYLWAGPEDIERVARLIEDVTETHELDPDRRFAIGFGVGARLIHELHCTRIRFRAIVSTSFRMTEQHSRCPDRAVARLEITPKEPSINFQGGTPLSADAMQKRLLEGRTCTGTTEFEEMPGVVCVDHGCEPTLVGCDTIGGRHWQGLSPLGGLPLQPEAPALHAFAFEFFADHDIDARPLPAANADAGK